MDGFREYPGEFDIEAAEAAPAADVQSAIGADERRMHVRAYNYWCSLLAGRDYPSIEDLEPGDVRDFAPHSVLLDFTSGPANPGTPYIGAAIREECGLDAEIRTIADVPARSLLSRLTDHYLQIIANRAPIGFEAEFVNQRDEPICYRGILMPFSSDGDTIDFIYGVINWKKGNPALGEQRQPQASDLLVEPAVEEQLADASEPVEQVVAPASQLEQPAEEYVAPEHSKTQIEVPEIELGEDAGLADRLWAARETADQVKSADHRSRAALYRALSLAYDFALAAARHPEDYAELLEESGMKAQARAPMTPIVKLVFGIDYDKTRLTEFAAALSYAQRQEVAGGGFQSLIESQVGGLKALVAAERHARRPEQKPNTGADLARARLRSASPLRIEDIAVEDEFSLVVTRRGADGAHEAVAVVTHEALVERAIRRAAA